MNKWQKAQKFESSWWNDCINTLGEEIKQLEYARLMGVSPLPHDLKGKSVIDIGGGPVSMLLKCTNRGECTVIDPCDYPKWVHERYKTANILFLQRKGEDLVGSDKIYDEVWIYNCLQHTEDPKKVVENAKRMGKVLRIFEWVHVEADEGHLHVLTPELLSEWIGEKGKVVQLDRNGCKGLAFYGEFKIK